MVEQKTVLTDRRILIVEDDPLLAMELAEEFEQIGAMPVGPVMTVASALIAVRTCERIDVALMNVNLRGELSLSVVTALVERGVPFLFLTGDDAFVRELYFHIPCHPKPARMPVLIKELSELAQSPASEKSSSVAQEPVEVTLPPYAYR